MRKHYESLSTLPVALALLFCVANFSFLSAQINYGGTPSFISENDDLTQSRVVTQSIDRNVVDAADIVTDLIKEVPWRFGIENEVNYSPTTNGYWSTEGEENIWRLSIESPEATSMSIRFSEFDLEKGAYLFIWSEESHEFLGKFDHRNNKEWGGLATGVLPGSQLIIELHQPHSFGFNSPITIDQVVHGYRSLLRHAEALYSDTERGPFGNSGACNINVNCPEGATWATEKRSVALIVQGGFAACTGSLVNNTLNDGTPYFLTANHCLGNPSSWVYYFNHESATCDGNTGPTNQSISGGTLLVSNAGSDFALIELSEVPPAAFNVQYSGWDASGDIPLSATGIHHPSGDVKKICFEENSPSQQFQGGAEVWFINEWELGVTEGGSSGSPLFDQNHRIIGQLYGGSAACSGSVNNGQADWYGRFHVSWGLGASDYLDPTGTGITIWDGFPDGTISFANDAGVSISGAPENLLCGTSAIDLSIVLTNTGTDVLTSATITYNINGSTAQQIDWAGNLAQYESESITIPTFNSIDGENIITVSVTSPNGVLDENNLNNNADVNFLSYSGDTFDFQLAITLDGYGTETTWEIRNLGTVIYSGGPYADDISGTVILNDLCLQDGCYIFEINDSFGDGMCCEYGDGFWTIFDQDGDIISTSDGIFTTSELDQFCTAESSVEGVSSDLSGLMYPNPANEILTIEFPEFKGHVFITDIAGRTMLDKTFNNETKTTIDVSNWSEGLYVVTWLGNDNEIMTRRISVIH